MPDVHVIGDDHVSPSFAELGVDQGIVDALGKRGIERTFAIQELTLPLALAGNDLIGQARTGMGKTYGFGVPLLNRLITQARADVGEDGLRALDGTPRALIIVPTRELCVQVTEDLERAADGVRVQTTKGERDLKITSIYGGRPYEAQIEALQKGVDVVVGTPGRLLDLANQGHLVLGKIQILVLDEADEMLDLGFLPDIEKVLGMVPTDRQTMLFSATMPGPIITLARTFLRQPTHVRAEHHDDSAVHERTTQFVYRAHALDKVEMVAKILQAEGRGATMIFTRTKRTAQKVADELAERGFKVGAVHGDLGQVAREKALGKFRDGGIDVLVATDVAARGIDIDDVTHVINFQCPEDDKTYVHRIGRTGRAGKTGTAVTFVDWDELHRWELIDKALGLGKPEPAETYSSSEHLFTDLGIDPKVKGSLPGVRKRAEGEVVERKPREKRERTRTRTRTRGGQKVDGAAPAEAATEALTSDGAPSEAVVEGSGDGADAPARKRRRRRRSGAKKTEGAAPAEAAAE
ncbi:DEAD/DEAH box helicase [Tsukamurella sp. NPDC003166]|uniref:DEAD/DEAH box helicase n=1 Tax=Tsukamurella sp. NPDC003166 TaxID=3154444 RepID=UPI0033B4E67A